MCGASSWSFGEEDARRIEGILSGFLGESNARTALIVDRTGQLVATVGEAPAFDPTAFASLTAADFSANDQLARMLGEPEFGALFHQGERESMYLADIARRVILVVLFDNRTTLGLVKLRVRATVQASSIRSLPTCSAAIGPSAPGWSRSFWATRKTKSTNSSGPEETAPMSMINYASREINCKLVYYGPGLGGKTTNLEFVYNKVAPGSRGKMISLATETERTLFFDFLPVDLGTIRGFKVKFHLYTVPGPGLLQRLAEADPQGRGRRRVRGRQPARADGSEHRGDAEPVRQHGAARLRPDQAALCHPVQQARPPQRRADRRAPGGAQPRLGGRGSGAPAAGARTPITRAISW